MPARWYCPLDRGLEMMAVNSLTLDLTELRQEFWGDALTEVGKGWRQDITQEALGDTLESAALVA